jgi:hypothetical protein
MGSPLAAEEVLHVYLDREGCNDFPYELQRAHAVGLVDDTVLD